ncbi:MAG: hypothetical protein SOW18_01830 [Peptoniphilus sp.]|nr:hypothetical protein [Peptoniphilus sp.]MDY3118259.1 hypothetical protein [Peptoniphilus sp.]
MEEGIRTYYLHTEQVPDENGFLAVDRAYVSRLKVGDGLWLLGEKRRFFVVDGISEEGVYLTEMEAIFPEGEGNLPVMRENRALMPMAVQVEHKGDGTGPGEMVIELYGKDGGGLFKSASDEEDNYLAESLKGLLRMQIKTMESTAEIGNLWIRRLREKQRRK